MSAVYGSFIEHFAELRKAYDVWNKEDKSDVRRITAVFIPTKGDGLHRQKYTSGNTAIDARSNDTLFIKTRYKSQIKEGDYVQKVHDNITMRVLKRLPYDDAAGYFICTIERLTGTTPDKTEDLPVKEAVFA